MQQTKGTDLGVWGLTGAVIGYALFDLAYNSLPNLPIAAGSTLLFLAVVEGVLAFWVSGRIKAGTVTEPVVVARFVTLAKASSILGTLMVGFWLGTLGYLVPRAASTEHAKEDVPSAVISLVCAALLIGAALWLERSCRTPDQSDDDEDSDSGYYR